MFFKNLDFASKGNNLISIINISKEKIKVSVDFASYDIDSPADIITGKEFKKNPGKTEILPYEVFWIKNRD